MGATETLKRLLISPSYEAFCRAELADPYELLDELRSVAPVHRSEILGAWVVTSYELVNDGLREHRLSHDRVAVNARGIPGPQLGTYASLITHISNWLGFTDPPKHSRMREIARQMLNPALAVKYRPWVGSYVKKRVPEMREQEHVDLVEGLALRLPLALMCEALGVGDTNMTQFHSWTADVALFAARVDPQWGPDAKATVDRSNDSWLALEDMFRRLIVEKRVRPADDMLSALVRHFDDGTISEDELIGLSVFFLAAGHGTTRDLLTNGLYLLLAHPQEAKKLANGPGLIGVAVEEVLRYESPIPMVSQLAVESFDLGGTMIGKGDAVVLQLSGANRDPDRFPDAAAFDIARQDNRHLAFGWGAHFCLGAPLARMEAAVVFQAMAPLLPELELESTEPMWKTGDLTERTLTELPVSWVSATVDQLGNEDRDGSSAR